MDDPDFWLLIVCTGNLCRSPITDPPTSRPVQRAAQVVTLAREIRGLRAPLRADQIDIDDPIGQRLPAFRRCLDTVLAAVAPIVAVLAPDRSDPADIGEVTEAADIPENRDEPNAR